MPQANKSTLMTESVTEEPVGELNSSIPTKGMVFLAYDDPELFNKLQEVFDVVDDIPEHICLNNEQAAASMFRLAMAKDKQTIPENVDGKLYGWQVLDNDRVVYVLLNEDQHNLFLERFSAEPACE